MVQGGHPLFGSSSHLWSIFQGRSCHVSSLANPFDVVLVRTVGRDFSGRPTHIGPRGDNASRRCRARPIHLEQFHDGLYWKHRFRHADDRWRERSGLGTASIGNSSTGSGLVSVTGSGSTWASTYLYIGNSGSGTLSITNGGSVSVGNSYIGNYAGSTGVVMVDGTGSTWSSGGLLSAVTGGSRSPTVAALAAVTATSAGRSRLVGPARPG